MNHPATFSSTAHPSCFACAGECLACCFNDAIVFDSAAGYRVIEENCAGCGACIPACEPGLIALWHGVATIATAPLAACAA